MVFINTTITTAMQLGSKIQESRKKQNLTQRELAAASGVGVRFIVDLEKGKETAEIGKALKVVKMFGIKMDVKIPAGDKE
ncbi:MAG: type II toxin-antitoxin system Y4mF family antitoxin [Endomicrobium sp.]|jgi:y4mF family transcriptional regulator|nr:type II toxin-antitoxin system Y4mF family antitoxin [Endomicrobium sp.]